MSPVTPITPHPKRTAMAHHVVIKPVRNWIPIAVLIVLSPFVVWAAIYFVSRCVRAVSVGAAAPSTINHRLLTIHRASSTIDHPYVASSIKGVYHRADCRYAASVAHRREYASHEEAAADGKVPCKVCLPVLEVASNHRE